MPTLIRLSAEGPQLAVDDFAFVPDGEIAPASGDVVVSYARLQAEGEDLRGPGRRIGVRLGPADRVEALAYDLPGLALVELDFPKFRDGRAFSSARLLRERLGFNGEVRAVGEVLPDQAFFMARCGFDAFQLADGADVEEFRSALRRYRHVYQRAADGRAPAFEARRAVTGVSHGV